MSKNVRRLVESALLIAIAIVLELISKAFIPNMPFGGQVTILSMLPIVLISYRHGVKWGFFAAFVYALLEMVIGAKTVIAAFQPGYFEDNAVLWRALLMCFLDYILAFTLLGLGGVFRNCIKKRGVALMCGSIVALVARYAAHVLSGYILFGAWGEWFFTQEGFPAWGAHLVESVSPNLLAFLYSLVYNGIVMVPEIILTAIASLLIGSIPGIVAKQD